MSHRLVNTLRTTPKKPYLHSPVDDLESFYYTAQWATAFNDGTSGGRYNGTTIQDFRDMIAGGEREQATNLVVTSLQPLTAEEEYGPFFARSLYLLVPWKDKLTAINRDWINVLHKANLCDAKDREEYLDLNFLIYGYRGVVEYLELVHEHRESLQETA